MTTTPLLSLFLLIISIYSSLFNHAVVSAQCLSHQQSLLLQLKDSLTFNATESTILTKWNQSSDCCTWEGVSCEQGRLTGLKLSNESISGGINDNSTLFNLQYLQSLDLSYNYISSTIPSRIGNLINLSYLNFSHVFGGQIPKEISHLKQLLILDLSYYYFLDFRLPNEKQLESPNLRMLVQNLTKLEELYLDGVNISAPGNEWGQALSSSLPNLRVLSLCNCGLSGPIHHSLTKLQYLSVIRLADNYLSSPVPRFFVDFSNLTSLILGSSGLYGKFPNEIFHIPTLRVLDISSNELLEGSLPEFPPNSDLQFLSIRRTNFKGRLPSSIGNLRQLTHLDLSDCLFSGPLPSSIGNLRQLTHLYLSDCLFSGPLPSSIGNLRQLTHLVLSDCLFSGPLPSSIGNLRQLKLLFLYDCLFSGPLPSSIGNLRQLTDLYLSDCLFSGPLPKSIAKLTQLVHLDLSYNQFVGPIPSFDMTKNLEEIDLSSNHLSGPISSSHLGGLLNLLYIDLRNNSFNGNIPASLFTLPLLKEIYLSENQFSGQVLEFPNASSSMLESIDLSSNKLQGPIPMSIFKLRALEYLKLSFNNFNGTTQLDMIEGLTNLQFLDLSFNNMSVKVNGIGPIFSFPPNLWVLQLASCNLRKFPNLSNLRGLDYLDLSYNQIYGEIPNWIWNLGKYSLNLSHNHLMSIEEPYNISSSIEEPYKLDLSFNQLHGKIPILPPDTYHLDLSSNSFTSSIPSDVGKNLRNTVFFSLSNNSLSGIIPESICEARNLEVLDLSNNNLNGIIPTCLLAMNWTNGVNLRKNNLGGPIPDLFPVGCSLRTLDLNGNLLTKSIPKSLANCSALEDLDLGNNQMVDTFPMLLKNISTLSVLILRSNKFYGQITCTESIGDWPVIQIVDIASNNFGGELPGKCLTKWHTMMTAKGYGQSKLESSIAPAYPSDEPSIAPAYPSDEPSIAPAYPSDEPSIAPADPYGYEDAVSITNKGLQMEMLRIVRNGFTYIDFSSNKFHGEIPKEFGQLISLHGLNLSNNVLSGHIPSSFGNMRQLESLDLSSNHLSGKIPASLSNLNFLGFLNLSYNQLHGRIPTGIQIQTFSADRFQGNQGLCGLPLTPNCPGDHVAAHILPETRKVNDSISGNNEIEWNLISAEIGFIVGFGTVIGPLVFWKRWRRWYFDRVEDIAFSILPQKLLRKWLSWKMGTRRGVRVNGRRAT